MCVCSKAAGHQGCSATNFSVYWWNLTKELFEDDNHRGLLKRRSKKWIDEQLEDVVCAVNGGEERREGKGEREERD